MRLVLYTGKGGVGKTTTAASTAVCAAARGRRTLVASADAAHSLGDVFECRLGSKPIEIAPGLDAIEIDARVEMTRHWGRIRDFLVSMFEYHGIDSAVAEELALLPGAEEITTLIAMEEYAESGGYDFVVIDCAPSDSTLRLVTLPDIAHRLLRILLPVLTALSGVATPIVRRWVSTPLPDSGVFKDANDFIYRHLVALKKRITHPETSVRIVVTPERMVIDEARRAHTDLALFEVSCDAVIVNRLLPEAAASEEFFRHWSRVHSECRREVEQLFAPLPLLTAPLQPDEVTGLTQLAAHGEQIFTGVQPDALLSKAPRVRFAREGVDFLAVVPLPNADPRNLDVAKVGDELTIATASRRRSFVLPRRYVPLQLCAARLEGGSLIVRFTRNAAADVGP